MFSTFAMLCFTVLAVRGGGTDITLMRPTKGSPGAIGVFEGIAPSSAYIRSYTNKIRTNENWEENQTGAYYNLEMLM